LYFHSVSATDNYVKCPCKNFIKRHFNQYFVNNNNNNNNKVSAPAARRFTRLRRHTQRIVVRGVHSVSILF